MFEHHSVITVMSHRAVKATGCERQPHGLGPTVTHSHVVALVGDTVTKLPAVDPVFKHPLGTAPHPRLAFISSSLNGSNSHS
jgi:hypothetical protein